MKGLSKHSIVVGILIIFYLVGLTGISIASLKDLTVSLTPLNLLLTISLFIWGNGQYDVAFFKTLIIVFLIGYGVEVAGVNTGMLFGDYYYGSPLGFQLFHVPLMIGVNWCLLSLAACGIAMRLVKPIWARVVLASVLMVLLDMVMEPVAVTLDFWNWVPLPDPGVVPPRNFDIPLQNYGMWFVTALVINTIILSTIKQIDFRLATFIFGLQAVFFALLNVLL